MSNPRPSDAADCERCARRLSTASGPAVAWATVQLALVIVATRLLPYGRLHRWAHPVRAASPTACPRCAARLVAAASAVLGHRPTCLARALVLARRLRRSGHDARVVIGVSRQDGLAAHAWVACDGLVLGDEAAASGAFTALAPAPDVEGRP